MTPTEIDECELWQIAVLLGADRPEEEAAGSDLDQLAARIEAEKESLRARMAKTRPEPEPEAPGPVDKTAEVMRSMGIVTK